MKMQRWPWGQESVSRAAAGPSRRAAGRWGEGAAEPRTGGSRPAAGRELPGSPAVAPSDGSRGDCEPWHARAQGPGTPGRWQVTRGQWVCLGRVGDAWGKWTLAKMGGHRRHRPRPQGRPLGPWPAPGRSRCPGTAVQDRSAVGRPLCRARGSEGPAGQTRSLQAGRGGAVWKASARIRGRAARDRQGWDAGSGPQNTRPFCKQSRHAPAPAGTHPPPPPA